MIHRITAAGEWPKTAKCGARIPQDPSPASKVHAANRLGDVLALSERIRIKPCRHCWPADR